MKIVTNTKLIRRNAAVGKYTSIGALVVLGIGLYITFKAPEQFAISMGCLLAGFILSQVGIYFGNRWGRNPRPDQVIDNNLKGLGREYTMYHFVTPASHLLVGPAGIWSILPYHQGGRISFDGKKWHTKGGGFARSYLRIFGQENIGRPDLEAEAEKRSITNFIKKTLPGNEEAFLPHAALLFTDPNVELDAAKSPLPAMKPKDLKEFLKAQAKEEPMPPLLLDALKNTLPQPEKEE
jgi:hypothetical protein